MNKDDDLKKDDELKDADFKPAENAEKPTEKPAAPTEDKDKDPENKAGQEKPSSGKKKDNVYEKFQYWGSEPPSGKGPMVKKGKPFTFILFIVLLLSMVFFVFFDRSAASSVTVPYSQFLKYVDAGSVTGVNIQDETKILFTLQGGQNGNARIPYYDSSLLSRLEGKNITVEGSVQPTSVWMIVLQLVPWIIFGVLMFMMFRQMGAAGGGIKMNSFGKSHAQMADDKDRKVTFKDVAGQKEAKYELEEVVDFLRHPERFTAIGAKIPKGVLLVGPPGTGKTLLARAVAGEAGVAFFHTSGSDFVEMFVGMGAARVRDLFEQGRKNAPCILFIDELDAVGRARGSGLGGGHDEREQTLNQLLVEMDGFSSDPGIIVIAATNRPDVLDSALLRPGRFDRQVVVDLPDVQERLDILRIHTRKVKLASDVDLTRIARATPGSSGADIANLVNEAALFAARKNRTEVEMLDFENARDKIVLGVARESRYMTEDEKKATAYHEAGHTLLHYYLKHTDPLHKVTIVPHGRALGLTISLPEKDQYTINRSALLDRIKICMGGYVAEKIVYGETTTGTSNDIKQATELAHRMVTEWGMSSLGFIGLASDDEPLFLGREIAQHKDFSDATAGRIDDEMMKILNTCMNEATSILTEHRNQLDELTEKLCEKETLDDSEIREMFGFPPVEHTAELI
jgi:ATP-dependent metalloprotease FtsH